MEFERPAFNGAIPPLEGNNVACDFAFDANTLLVATADMGSLVWSLGAPVSLGATIDAASGIITIAAGASLTALSVAVDGPGGSDSAVVPLALTTFNLPEFQRELQAVRKNNVANDIFFDANAFLSTVSYLGTVEWTLVAPPEGVCVDAAAGIVNVPAGLPTTNITVALTNTEGTASADVPLALVTYNAPIFRTPVPALKGNNVTSDLTFDASTLLTTTAYLGTCTWALQSYVEGVTLDASSGIITVNAGVKVPSVSVVVSGAGGTAHAVAPSDIVTYDAPAFLADVPSLSGQPSFDMNPMLSSSPLSPSPLSSTSSTGNLIWSLEYAPPGVAIDPHSGVITMAACIQVFYFTVVVTGPGGSASTNVSTATVDEVPAAPITVDEPAAPIVVDEPAATLDDELVLSCMLDAPQSVDAPSDVPDTQESPAPADVHCDAPVFIEVVPVLTGNHVTADVTFDATAFLTSTANIGPVAWSLLPVPGTLLPVPGTQIAIDGSTGLITVSAGAAASSTFTVVVTGAGGSATKDVSYMLHIADVLFDIRASTLTSSPVAEWGPFSQPDPALRPMLTESGGYNGGAYVSNSGSGYLRHNDMPFNFDVSSGGGFTFACVFRLASSNQENGDFVIGMITSNDDPILTLESEFGNFANMNIALFDGSTCAMVASVVDGFSAGDWHTLVVRYDNADMSAKVWSTTASGKTDTIIGTGYMPLTQDMKAASFELGSIFGVPANIDFSSVMLAARPFSDAEVACYLANV
jgi:hypothetical protein